jgi:hypothetical protein
MIVFRNFWSCSCSCANYSAVAVAKVAVAKVAVAKVAVAKVAVAKVAVAKVAVINVRTTVVDAVMVAVDHLSRKSTKSIINEYVNKKILLIISSIEI